MLLRIIDSLVYLNAVYKWPRIGISTLFLFRLKFICIKFSCLHTFVFVVSGSKKRNNEKFFQSHCYPVISHLTRLALSKLIKKTNKYCRWCGLMDSPD